MRAPRKRFAPAAARCGESRAPTRRRNNPGRVPWLRCNRRNSRASDRQTNVQLLQSVWGGKWGENTDVASSRQRGAGTQHGAGAFTVQHRAQCSIGDCGGVGPSTFHFVSRRLRRFGEGTATIQKRASPVFVRFYANRYRAYSTFSAGSENTS
jgi:hypothetical protein